MGLLQAIPWFFDRPLLSIRENFQDNWKALSKLRDTYNKLRVPGCPHHSCHANDCLDTCSNDVRETLHEHASHLEEIASLWQALKEGWNKLWDYEPLFLGLTDRQSLRPCHWAEFGEACSVQLPPFED